MDKIYDEQKPVLTIAGGGIAVAVFRGIIYNYDLVNAEWSVDGHPLLTEDAHDLFNRSGVVYRDDVTQRFIQSALKNTKGTNCSNLAKILNRASAYYQFFPLFQKGVYHINHIRYLTCGVSEIPDRLIYLTAKYKLPINQSVINSWKMFPEEYDQILSDDEITTKYKSELWYDHLLDNEWINVRMVRRGTTPLELLQYLDEMADTEALFYSTTLGLLGGYWDDVSELGVTCETYPRYLRTTRALIKRELQNKNDRLNQWLPF